RVVPAHDPDVERVGGVARLLAPARDEAGRVLDDEIAVTRERLAGLVVPVHEAREHERLRLGAGLGETTLDEQDVESLLRHVAEASRQLAATRRAPTSRAP